MSDPLQIYEETSAFSSSPVYYEWTDGVAYAMSNTPSAYHQTIQDELTQQLNRKDKKDTRPLQTRGFPWRPLRLGER